MYNEIFTSLINYGFINDKNKYIKTIEDNSYEVYENEDTIYVSILKDFIKKEDKIMVLDKIESICKKYGITSAGFKLNKPYLVLSKPSHNVNEEVKRIRYLVQNLNQLVFNTKKKSEIEPQLVRDFKDYSKSNSALIKDYGITEGNNSIKDESSIVKENKSLKKEESKVEDNNNSNTETSHDKENEPIYRATAAMGSKTYGAYGYTKDSLGNKQKGSDMTNEGYSFEGAQKYIANLKKKRENLNLEEEENENAEFLGILGSILGAILSIVLLSILHQIGFNGSYFAFIIGLLIYFGYINISKLRRVPIRISLILILLSSLSLGLLMNSIEIREALNVKLIPSLIYSLEAFFNNKKYVIGTAWSRLFITLLLALIGFIVPKVFLERNIDE